MAIQVYRVKEAYDMLTFKGHGIEYKGWDIMQYVHLL